MAAIFLVLGAAAVRAQIVQVNNCQVGLKRTMGELHPELLKPGWHLYVPFFQELWTEDVCFQSDRIERIPLVTKDKQKAWATVEVRNKCDETCIWNVVNQFQKPNVPYDVPLIKTAVKQFIMELAAKHTGDELRNTIYGTLNELVHEHLQDAQARRPELGGKGTGLQILGVTMPPIELEREVESKYQEVAQHKAAVLAEAARQNRTIMEKETESKLKELEANADRTVAATKNLRDREEATARAMIQTIEAEAAAAVKKMAAEADKFSKTKEAEANKELLTPPYMQYQAMHSWAQAKTHYFASPSGEFPVGWPFANLLSGGGNGDGELTRPPSGGGGALQR